MTLRAERDAMARAPHGNWWGTWLIVLQVVGLVLVGLDAFWRQRGLRPAMFEPGRPWAEELGAAFASRGEYPLTIVGSSRSSL